MSTCPKHPQAYRWDHADGPRCAICGEPLPLVTNIVSIHMHMAPGSDVDAIMRDTRAAIEAAMSCATCGHARSQHRGDSCGNGCGNGACKTPHYDLSGRMCEPCCDVPQCECDGFEAHPVVPR